MRPAALFLLLSPFFAHGNAPAGEANPVDDYFSGYWKEEKIRPALPANDYEFLRRLTLDLSGRLPTPGEIRSFVRNRSPEKRALKIEELLVEESTAQFWADQWLRILFQYRFAETDPVKVHFPSFVGWLKNAFRSDMPYDRFLTHLVSDRGDYKKKPATNYILKHLDPKEPPVELTSRMTRVFLGYQVQCAQCHDHPTAEWSQESFWGLTAFFSGLQSKPRATFEGVSVKLFDKGAGEIGHPSLAPGRAQPARHLRSETGPVDGRPRQGDRNRASRRPFLRLSPPAREKRGPLFADPLPSFERSEPRYRPLSPPYRMAQK